MLEGKVLDLATQQPLDSRVRLERVEPQAKGGYTYPQAAETIADSQGHWVFKKVPAGWYRVVVEKTGFAPRIAGYSQFDDQPHWYSYDCSLARLASVSGRVTDEAGQPLADVKVRFGNVTAGAGGRYESPDDPSCQTDAEGRFQCDRLPAGGAAIWVTKFGYVRPGLGEEIKTPAENVAMVMKKSARLRVRVDFGGAKRPQQYLVDIEPEGGSKIGSWGGSGSINDHNEIAYSEIPPGRYVLRGHPNPSSANETTDPLTVDLKGGRLTEVTISARPAR